MERYSQEIRFLLTKRCTYNCSFCHGEGLQTIRPELLDVEDINFIFNTARLRLGFESTTLTGGEPLIRQDIEEVAKRLYENFGKVTITTNGFLLSKKICIGNYVDRVNVSIHSLNKETYEMLSGRKDVLQVVIYGLQKLRDCFPKLDIRINTTLIKNINSDKESINELLSFASRLNASIKFIEMYPSSLNQFVSPDGTIKPCRHASTEIDILPETKNRDVDGLYQKLLLAYSMLRNNCVMLQS